MPRRPKTPAMSAAQPSVPTAAAIAYAAVEAEIKAVTPDALQPQNPTLTMAIV